MHIGVSEAFRRSEVQMMIDYGELVSAGAAASAVPKDGGAAKLLAAPAKSVDSGNGGRLQSGLEEELQGILDATGDGIALIDTTGKVVRMNRRIMEASGYIEEELIGKPFDALNILSPESNADMPSLLNSVLSGRQVTPFEAIVHSKSGEKLHVEVRLSPLRRNEKIAGIVVAIGNLAGSERTAGPWPNCDDLSPNPVETTNDWTWEVNEKAVYTSVSPGIRGVLGYEPEEVVGRTLFDMMPLKEAHQMTTVFLSALAERRPLRVAQMTNMHKDGHLVFLETSAVPFFDRAQRICGYRGIHRDVTGHSQTEGHPRETLERLKRTLDGIIQAITLTVESRDRFAAGHQQRVAHLACAMAQEMGVSSEQIDGIRIAGLLHDIGTISVPSEILSKPGALNEVEFAIIKIHPEAGYDILRNIEFPWPVAQIVLQHHEKMNGSGYPLGLKGEEILLEARILAVADVVEAMSHHRSYRPALGLDRALKEIFKNKGVLYDPNAVDACFKVSGRLEQELARL